MLAIRQLRRASCLSRLLVFANGAAASGAATPATANPCSLSDVQAAVSCEVSAWRLLQVAHMSKAAKQKGGKKGAPAAATGEAPAFDSTSAQQLMAKAVDHLQHELAGLRTGRATPGMLDHLKVEVYGERMPLKACGTVLVRDPQLLAITVFDPSTMEAVQKSIRESPLQLNPVVEGQEVLVPIPRPTQETVQAMMKMCKSEGEQAKVSVRHARKAAMDEMKKAELSEDDRHRVEKDIQKLTDDFVAQIDNIVQEKEKSITVHSS